MYCNPSTYELYHHGVKGMKWGKRKAQPYVGGMRRMGNAQSNSDAANASAARKAKAKKAVKVGAAVAGATIAAYGAYKVSKFVKNKKTMNTLRTLKNNDWLNAQRRGDSPEAIDKMLKRYNDQIASVYKNRWK